MNKALMLLRKTDWRILMGIVITALWMIAGIIYLRGGSIDKSILDIPLQDIGSFLEGAFAPLAFLWLVIGLFVQQKELSDNTEVLRQTSIQSQKQTQAIAATEMNARQEAFFKIADNVKEQLGGISGMLFISCMGATEGQLVTKEKLQELWHMLARGDNQVFSREFLLLDQDLYGGYETLFYKTKIRRRHSENFIRTLDRLMVMARNCDNSDGIIADTVAQTAHGLIYKRMRDNLPEDMQEQCANVECEEYETAFENSQMNFSGGSQPQ